MTDSSYPAFEPHPWLRNGHAQTIAGAFWYGPRLPHRAEKHLVAVSEGDQVVLHDDRPPKWRAGQRVALLLHGLSGSHRSSYMARTAAKLVARGVRVFRMDLRGHGAGFRHAKLLGHAGRSEDAAAALACVEQLCPRSPVFLVGFSMGANIVLKLLGELATNIPECLAGAIAVSPPIDIAHCSQHMTFGKARFYSRRFVRTLTLDLKQRRRFVAQLRSLSLRRLPRNLYEFDCLFTAPLSGFSDAEHYYRECSAGPLLPNVELPTRIVAAADDPVIPVQIFRSAQLSPAIQLHITRHGGHIGYVGIKGVDPDRHWLEWRIVEWITQQEVRLTDSTKVPVPRPSTLRPCQAFSS